MIPLLLAAAIMDVPSDPPRPQVEEPTADQPRRVEPIGGYTLALIWTPEHCARPVPGAESFVCGEGAGKGFALHGLWPDGRSKTWPQWCRSAAILPSRTIAAYYRATPSPQLMQHEWAKHGTCMAVKPEAYFARSNRLFYRLRFPDMATLAREPLSAVDVARAFAAANQGLKSEMIRLNLDGEGWLREVWLCLDIRFRYRKCEGAPLSRRPVHIRTAG